ncbi:MAG: NUDIX domain-containing protein [Actinomycetota bacterium]
MGSPADEAVEVIGVDGAVERVVTRAEMRAGNLRHRNIAVLVRRSDGRLVVHRRADWKDVYPSLWDVAFGGVPGVGEADADAAVRELAEEAGIDVSVTALQRLGTFRQETEAVSWVGVFYSLTTDAPLHPADGEVAEMAEIDPIQVHSWARTHPVCPDVEPLLETLVAWLT